jgi:hypothetical protein
MPQPTANQPLLTREEFLTAVREECIGAELALPEQELVNIDRIQCRRAREFSRMFVRLRDDIAAIPILSPPTGQGIAFVGEANWGLDAEQIVEAAIEQARNDLDSLQHLLAGLAETGPAQTD